MKAVSSENLFNNDYHQAAVEAGIQYPCYKSLDEYIDIERLRSLDDYIIERINRHIETQKENFFVNLYRLEENTPYLPGVREIWLSRPKPNMSDECLDQVDQTELWQRTEAAEEFAALMDFIETLPFQAMGRMLIIYDDSGKTVPAHRDHLNSEVCNEFIWMRTNFNKNLYFLNPATGERKDVEGYTAWFDAVNQYHGSDAAGERGSLSFSLRVDGKFTDDFKKQIPQPKFNLASTPALWAAISGS